MEVHLTIIFVVIGLAARTVLIVFTWDGFVSFSLILMRILANILGVSPPYSIYFTGFMPLNFVLFHFT